MAKDVAAFANVLGGVILIGTSRDDEALAYPGLPRARIDEQNRQFESAIKDHLSPSPPSIERLPFQAPGSENWLLAINVPPFPDQIVGSRVAQDTWRFLIRATTTTNYLEPAMLPLYAAEVRRNAILLVSISAAETVRICFRNPLNSGSDTPVYWEVKLGDILIERNVFSVTLPDAPQRHHRVPLSDVDGVWDAGSVRGGWVIRVLGYFSGTQASLREYHSNPTNARFGR